MPAFVSYSERTEARSLAASLEADDRVSIPGWLSSEECREILKPSHAFALFSHAEGLPLAMQEALANGLPVLTSANSGIDEVVVHGENGLLAAAGDVIELTNCLATAIGNPDLLRSLGAGALETAKAHQIEMYWDSVSRIYAGLLTSHYDPTKICCRTNTSQGPDTHSVDSLSRPGTS